MGTMHHLLFFFSSFFRPGVNIDIITFRNKKKGNTTSKKDI